MKVREISEALANRQEWRAEAPLREFTVDDQAATLSVGGGLFRIDETAERAIARYLNIPYKYLHDCPPQFKATTLRFWLNHKGDADTVLLALRGDIVSLHSPETAILPLSELAETVAGLFDPEDDAKLHVDEDRFHLDLTSERFQIEVPNPNRVPFRPEVGDITRGGIRVLAQPNKIKPPSVMGFMERLVCTNGMCTTQKSGEIAIKGRTVDEVLEEVEQAAQRILGDMENKLERYAHTAEMAVPGDPAAFAAQLAREHSLSRAVLDEALQVVNQVGEQATIYDVTQAFTQVANTGVPYNTALKLQTLGGGLAFHPEHHTSRCETCERLLG